MSDSEGDYIPATKRLKRAVIESDDESSELSENVEEEDEEDLSDVELPKSGSSKRPIDSTTEEEFDSDETDTDEEDDDSEDSDVEVDDYDVVKVFSDEESDIERYEDDSSGDDEKKDAIGQEKKGNASSDDDDENSPTCAICLGKLTPQKLPSKPDSGCEHTFCRECIVEWSKKVNTCPIDRRVFKVIIVYNRIGGNELARERCKQTRREEEPAPGDFDNSVLCERCGCGDREEALLLCDGCDLGYHMDCLVPSLGRIPRGRWYCPTCEATGLISDYLTLRPSRSGAFVEDPLPRTIENVRIRATIQRTINQVSALVGSVRSPKKRRRRTKKKTTTRKKKKSTKTKKSSTSSAAASSAKKKPTKKRKKPATSATTSSGGTKKKRKVKRKSKKKLSSAAKKKALRKLKRKDKEAEKQALANDGEKSLLPIPDFNLFGDKNDLMFYGDDEELYANPMPSSSSSSSSHPVQSRSKAAEILKKSSSKPVAAVKPIVRLPEDQPVNLLGEILTKQSEFLKPCSTSTIVPKEPSTKQKSTQPAQSSGKSSSNSGLKKTDNPALIKTSQKRSSEPSASDSLTKAQKAKLMEKAEDKVKTYLKPMFARGIISKDAYKVIMRKCVEKVYERAKVTPTIDEDKVVKLVGAYVDKYRD